MMLLSVLLATLIFDRAERQADLSYPLSLPPASVIEERLFTTPEATNIDYCQEREAFGHPMICVRSLSLHNALRRTALQHGCNIVSGVQCHDILPASPRGGGDKKALLVLMHDEQDSEQENKIVEADFIVGADGLKSIVRAHQGGRHRKEAVRHASRHNACMHARG